MRGMIGRSLALLLCTAVVAYAAGKTGGAKAAAPAVLRAQAFELVDARGRVCARLAHAPTGETKLDLLDPKGVVQARLTTGQDDGPSLALYDVAGKARMACAMPPDAGPGLMLLDAKEEPRLVLGATPSDYTGLAILDSTGQDRASLSLTERAGEARKRGAMLSLKGPGGRAEAVGIATEDARCGFLVRQGDTFVWRAPQEKE